MAISPVLTFLLLCGAFSTTAVVTLLHWQAAHKRDPIAIRAQRALNAGLSLQAFIRAEAAIPALTALNAVLGVISGAQAFILVLAGVTSADTALFYAVLLFGLLQVGISCFWPAINVYFTARRWKAPLSSKKDACTELNALAKDSPEIANLPALPRELRLLDYYAAKERLELAARPKTEQEAILKALAERQAKRQAERQAEAADRKACAELHSRLGAN